MDNMISVVVPIYNIEDYIKRTVESILNQTYKNIEVILVDDGSTDKSGEIIDNIALFDKRIKVIHKENGGVTSARIQGIKAASGEWIGFVDGDDYIEPEMFDILLNNALKYDADISHCGYQMVFPSRVDYYYNTKKFAEQDNQQGLIDLLKGDFVEPGLSNKLVKANIVKNVVLSGKIDESVKINEDLLMNYYFFKESKHSVYYDICPYHYMLRKGSAATSKVNKNMLYDPIKVQKTILDDVKGKVVLENIIINRLVLIYINGASMKNKSEEQMIDGYIILCKNELKQMKVFVNNLQLSAIDKFKYKLCVFSPNMYRVFHKLYSKIKGNDNKYEVK